MKILHTADWHIGQFKGPVVDGVNLRSQDTVKCLEYTEYVEGLMATDIKYKIEQRKADEEITHATGRVLFWLHHAIVKGEHNGELEEAFENLQRAEEHKKEMDREVLAKYSID